MESVTENNDKMNNIEATAEENASSSDILNENEVSDEMTCDPVNEVEPEEIDIIAGRCAKISKLVLFGINAVLMLIFTLRNFSVIGIAGFVIFSVLSFLIFYKSSKFVPAIVDLPVAILADVLIYLSVNFEGVMENLDLDALYYYFEETSGTFWGIVAIAVLFGAVSLGSGKWVWLTGVTGGIISFLLIMVGEGAGYITDHEYPYMSIILKIGVVLFALIWILLLYLIGRYVPKRVVGTVWIGIGLMLIFASLLIFESQFLKQSVPFFKTGISMNAILKVQWWHVIMICIVLFGLAFALFMLNRDINNGLCLDSYFVILAFEIILTSKILLTYYFSYNFLILVCIIIGTLKCIKNNYAQKTTMGLDVIPYLVSQYVIALALLFLMRNGWWCNVILGLVLIIVLYSDRNKRMRLQEEKSFVHWVIVLSGIISQGMALAWHIVFSAEIFTLLAIIFVLSVATVFIINMKAPGMRMAPAYLSRVVCLLVAFSCISVISGYPFSVDYEIDESEKSVQVDVTCRKDYVKEAKIEYYYRDMLGRRVAESKYFLSSSQTIPIEGEMLKIAVKADNGVVTTKTIWYPYDLNKLLNKVFR